MNKRTQEIPDPAKTATLTGDKTYPNQVANERRTSKVLYTPENAPERAKKEPLFTRIQPKFDIRSRAEPE
jgi:hypothetical protein